ncbi:unnamed protein product [Rhizoctonia solani]|uniref:Zn(2)-C6 fungal-type domain-containing protein n=1 Tax=Rhizoctonia solani TaxID=456999 RepID=A0A8H3GU25_9AGAM|nr:unnamed protein product [Rhizoctonia solani]
MPSKHRSAPGPRPESCLTCRQRKKKCDKTRPFCLRCLNSKGLFPCLGYEDETYEPEIKKLAPVLEERATNLPRTNLRPLVFGVEFGDAVPESSAKVTYYKTRVSASDINDYLTPAFISLTDRGSPESSLMSVASSMHRPVKDADWEPGVRRHGSDNAIRLSLPSMIPRGVNANRWMRESYLTFILGEYQRHRVLKFFRPPTNTGQGFVMAQLNRPLRLGLMYLGAKVFEAFVEKSEEVAIKLCSQWVTRYTNDVTSSEELQNPFPSTQEVEDRLSRLHNLALIQFIVLGTGVGYNTFRLALPNFLRLVSDHPDLWARQERNGLLRISLPAVLSSGRTEIQRFAFQDILYSLVLGVPTLAEYDSTGLPTAPGTNISADWFHDVHGAPAEMVIIISEVHSRRAQVKIVDWLELEMRTWSWGQVDTRYEESSQLIYRAAIQEAWRHATLMYIYMGMCGATSHDGRVQASVYQIIKLVDVVGDTNINGHLTGPLIVAGIAARYESQRTLIFNKLNSYSGVRVWLLQGADFARVLNHLWHGPAICGAAVGWDDYVQKRYEVLPIPYI